MLYNTKINFYCSIVLAEQKCKIKRYEIKSIEFTKHIYAHFLFLIDKCNQKQNSLLYPLVVKMENKREQNTLLDKLRNT